MTAEQPAFVTCDGCGTTWPKVWWAGSERFSARWTYPKVNPCSNCHIDPALARKKTVDRALMDCGFHVELMGYTFDQSSVAIQPANMSDAEFQASLLRQDRRRIGVLRRNHGVIRQLLGWKPPRWVLLHGPVGTGKTTMMAGLARRFTPDGTMRRVYEDTREVCDPINFDRTRATRMVSSSTRQMRYCRLEDIVEEQRNKFSPEKRNVQSLGKFHGILFLDELGIRPPRGMEQEVVEHVIGERSDKNRCTVVATNCTMEQLRVMYGERVYDRLRQALRVPLTGPSWRIDQGVPA